MLALLVIVTFVGAVVISIGTIAITVAPQWRRILRLASGQIEMPVPEVRS